MSLLDAIAMEAETVTITRFAVGTRSKGIVTPGSSSTFSAVVSLQPLRAREAQQLPEGIRQTGGWVLYGADELLATDTDPGSGRIGDRFTRSGKTYEVVQVEDWTTHGGYYRSVAVMVE